MSSRVLRSAAFLFLAGALGLAVAERASAGPTMGTGTPPATTPGPTPTAAPPPVPRITGVRAAQGVYTSGRFGWEIEIENPYPYRWRVTAVIDDPPGSAVYDIGASARGWFPFSRAALTDACTPKQAWTMWIETTPDQKRVFEMTPNCTFKAAPPTIVAATSPIATMVAGKISYANAAIKTPVPTCGQNLVVEADVTNRTGGKYTYVFLDFGPFQASQHFPLENGQTKRVATGVMPFKGFRGQYPVLLRAPSGGPDNPDIVKGSFVTAVTAECRPTFQMRGFATAP
jgi:hypothetical protein